MKRIFAVLIVVLMLLAGCASLTYRTADGTEVTYSRLFTSSDSIKGVVGSASVEANGQKLNQEVLQSLLQALIR